MRIESGVAAERTRKLAITGVVLLAAAGWFAYDGFVGYPRHNRDQYLMQFPPGTPADAVKVDPRVTRKLAAELTTATRTDIEKRLGEPHVHDEKTARWFGPAGVLVAPNTGTGAQIREDGQIKNETDLLTQRLIAALLGAGGLIALLRMLMFRSRRYTLDDRGLSGLSPQPIGWDQMTRLNGDQVDEKGWVDLHYTESGQPRSVRLDSYEIAAFGEIIDGICEKKGFENPLPVRGGPPA